MPLISRKKRVYPISRALRGYLQQYERTRTLPILFEDLTRYTDTVTLYDKHGESTLWETAIYSPGDQREISRSLVHIYAILKVRGDLSLVEHLVTDRIDVCTWANTNPFRIRILNTLNENFDYFYVKKADASRIYGLELEHLLSPSRIEFLLDANTVVEEHISGIPGDDFIASYLKDDKLDEVRLTKEFVKFNERCFVRLLGDMHAGNYVVAITPDFDEIVYRLRPIDFDQQSYEGRSHVYLPQYYRENNPIVHLGMQWMTVETFNQYRKEERVLIANRVRAEKTRLDTLLRVMADDDIAPCENVYKLREELTHHYHNSCFLDCESMGEIVRASLGLLM